MRYLFPASDEPAVGPATKVDVYYDRHLTRTWVARWVDDRGNQIGDCVYAHKKAWAVEALGDKPGEG